MCKNALLHGEGERVHVRRTGRRVRIPEGIFLGGFAPRAYFHHLAERISRLPLVEHLPAEYRGFPLLVPAETLDWPGLVDATELIAPGRELVPLSWENEYQVERLVWIDEIHRWTAGHPGVVTHLDAMGLFRRRVLDAAGITPQAENGLRLFIVRGERRRSPNESELAEASEQLGFVQWKPEQWSFVEQVRMWARAEVVVGDDGAAWTGAVFSPEGSSGLVVTDQLPSGWPHLGRVGRRSIQLHRVRSTSYGHADVDVDDFIARLREIVERVG
jgi:capsular polysaccharide biosynthesis protein